MTESKRNTFLDSIKFYLILLVIFGHLLGNYKSTSPFNIAIWNFIYLFHMPLFAFVSGYFTKPTTLAKFKTGVFRILETFVFLQILSLLPLILNETISFKNIITPWWFLWYLFALAIWKTIYFIFESKIKIKILLLISVIIALLIGFVPFIGYPLSLSRIFVFLPFFLLGVVGKDNYLSKIKSFPKIYSLLFLAIVFIGLFYSHIDLSLIEKSSYSYYELPSLIIGLLGRVLFFLAAISMSFAFINIMPDVKMFNIIGKDTLLYYIYHGYLILVLKEIINYWNLPINTFVLFGLSLGIIVLIYYFSKIELSRNILNPYSFWKKNHHDNSITKSKTKT
ncbi:MAG TPA: acyltransferase family protein [Edaphocola sp.]|nr:acyltransferase family protein [Edaphocola sp.]